jgi:propionate CoA-transferase
VINLGIGVPEVVAAVAAEERVLDHLTLTAEPGVIGGMPQGGLDFGAAVNTQALLHQNQQFDFYDGGGLDLACSGMAEVDRLGKVNVSASAAGSPEREASSTSVRTPDGWSSQAPFTAGGLEVAIEDGQVRIAAKAGNASSSKPSSRSPSAGRWRRAKASQCST